MATNRNASLAKDFVEIIPVIGELVENSRSRKAEIDHHCRDCIHDKNGESETQMTIFYCTQCPWLGAITQTVIFTNGKLTAILHHRCFVCGQECGK